MTQKRSHKDRTAAESGRISLKAIRRGGESCKQDSFQSEMLTWRSGFFWYGFFWFVFFRFHLLPVVWVLVSMIGYSPSLLSMRNSIISSTEHSRIVHKTPMVCVETY